MEEGNNQDQGFVKKTISPHNPVQLPPESQVVGQTSGLKNFYRENKWYVFAILGGTLLIAVLSYFAFKKTPAQPAKEADVNISISVPDTVPAGGEAVYTIKVDNQDKQKLTDMTLEITYPEGVSYISSVPSAQNLSGTIFGIPDLVSQQNAVLVIKTKASGSVNDTKTLNAKLRYHFSGFSTQFVKEQANSLRLTAADVVLELSGPTQANNAQLFAYNVKYQNNSSNPISGARIQLAYPQGFSFATAQPTPDSGNNIWNLPNLAPGDTGNITIQGNFISASPGESKTANVQFLVLGQDGQYFSQSTSEFTTQMASLPLIAEQEIGGSGDSVVKPGDTVNFNITYQNNSSIPVSGVNILVTLNSKAIDFSSIRAEGGQVDNNTILWNASSVSGLASLNPSNKGQLSFSVRVKNPAVKDSSKNLTLVSNIKIKANEYDGYFPGNDLTAKISSPANLSSSLIVSSGSMPPEVGKTNVYTVTFALTNSTNDFSTGVLTAFIPLGPGGFVAGSVNGSESGNVQYDSSTGKLTWNVGMLSAHTGDFSSPRTLKFSVKLTPSASQSGNSPTLVKNIQFAAKDTFTGQDVTLNSNDITTDNVPDSDGTVR